MLIIRLLLLFSFLSTISVVSSQVRLAPSRIRNSTLFRTTTSNPHNSHSTTSGSLSTIEKPSIVLQARTGQLFVYAFSHDDFQTKPLSSDSKDNKTKSSKSEKNDVRERYGITTVKSTLAAPTAKYDYTASIHGRPDLPTWLNLEKTPIDQSTNRAFLFGTPEREESMDDIMILARNLATNDVYQKLIRIQIGHDKRYSAPAKQIAELWIENYDAWELLSSSSTSMTSDLANMRNATTTASTIEGENEEEEENLLDELRLAISRAFRGRGVWPYIRDLKPATRKNSNKKTDKVGFVVYVGTSQGFPTGLQVLSLGLTKHTDMCNRTDIIPPDTYFAPLFRIDWCRFRVSNVTRSKTGDKTNVLIDGQQIRGATNSLSSYDDAAAISDFETHMPVRHYEPISRQRDYSWEWVMVAVVPLAILLVLVLILSAVFFGCREGQHWRDYKTPRDQLTEYVNLRRTQQRLRLLSNQRQSVDILDATEESASPIPQTRRVQPPSSPTLSLGKQTVGQAAMVRGSNIDLYKDSDSFDEREQLLTDGNAYRNQIQQQHQQGTNGQQQGPLRRASNDDQRMLIHRDSSV